MPLFQLSFFGFEVFLPPKLLFPRYRWVIFVTVTAISIPLKQNKIWVLGGEPADGRASPARPSTVHPGECGNTIAHLEIETSIIAAQWVKRFSFLPPKGDLIGPCFLDRPWAGGDLSNRRPTAAV